MAGLRAGLPDEETSTAITTLGLLIKAWQKTRGDQALDLVRKNKISWGTVVMAGSPTEIKKGKKKQPDQRVIASPSKPSTSPWLSVQERVKISKILSEKWSFSDELRKSWVALPPGEQHKQYDSYISKLKSGYEELNKISSSVHAKLGHRKSWIYKAVEAAGLMPKSKKDKEDNFKVSTIFFSSVRLSELHIAIKKSFSPAEYAEPFAPNVREIWSNLVPVAGTKDNPIYPTDFSLDGDGVTWELWQIWSEKFVPVISSTIVIPEAKGLSDDNIFAVLAEPIKVPQKKLKPASPPQGGGGTTINSPTKSPSGT
jgi:hypothetical protein